LIGRIRKAQAKDRDTTLSKMVVLAILLAFSIVISGPGHAQTEEADQAEAGAPQREAGAENSDEKTAAETRALRGGERAARLLKQIDADGNGSVSAKEFFEARLSRFADWDRDDNEQISVEEYLNGHSPLANRDEPGGDARWRKNFARLDRDGDGAVSLTEFRTFGESVFSRRDLDGDGSLNALELRESLSLSEKAPIEAA